MSLQFIINAKGQKTAVLVPYNEWEAINMEIRGLKHKLAEAELTLRFQKAFKDGKLFEQDELSTHSVTDLYKEF